MNTYLNNLNKMINKASRIKKEDVKREYTSKIISYAAFIYYSGYINDDEYNKLLVKIPMDEWAKVYTNERKISINNLIENNNLLNDFYLKIISTYNNYAIAREDDLIIEKDLKKVFINFLKYVNCYDLYLDLENKNMISYNSPVLNRSVCIGNRSDSYIIIHENDNLYRYMALVHEMGHSLENKILRTRKQYFTSFYTSEIIAITFNRLFLEYLKANAVLSDQDIKMLQSNSEYSYFDFVKWSYLITKMIKSNSFVIDDYNIKLLLDNYKIERTLTDYNYSLGSICSMSLIDMWRRSDTSFIKELPNIIFYLNKMELKELIGFLNNHDCVEKELKKTLIKK